MNAITKGKGNECQTITEYNGLQVAHRFAEEYGLLLEETEQELSRQCQSLKGHADRDAKFSLHHRLRKWAI